MTSYIDITCSANFYKVLCNSLWFFVDWFVSFDMIFRANVLAVFRFLRKTQRKNHGRMHGRDEDGFEIHSLEMGEFKNSLYFFDFRLDIPPLS